VDAVLVRQRDDEEIRALLSSAGHRLVGEIKLRRRPDPTSYVGRGKLEELKNLISEAHAQLLVVQGELRPSQHYHLEAAVGVECFDRLRLILEIFAQRAHGREARLQVGLAQLRYEVPMLREWIHRAKAGERPGFMAGGEYRVDVYYENIRRRMKRIRRELEIVRDQREQRRKRRKKQGFHLVALAGYANAGKSSLLNALTAEHVLVEERMFSTLSTATRRFSDARKRILLTDTVGFIDDVPLWLIDAFHSTLEEIYESDLILLLLDASDPPRTLERKIHVAARILLPQTAVDAVIPVLTKIDRVGEREIALHQDIVGRSPFPGPIFAVSSHSGQGLASLSDFLRVRFVFPVEIVVEIDQGEDGARFLSWLHDAAEVEEVDYRKNGVIVRLRCRRRDEGVVQRRGRVLVRRETASPTSRS
jgi:GTP-binding protein HflX